MLSFFQRGVLDEILNLIESVSEGFFPTLTGGRTGAARGHHLCLSVQNFLVEKKYSNFNRN